MGGAWHRCGARGMGRVTSKPLPAGGVAEAPGVGWGQNVTGGSRKRRGPGHVSPRRREHPGHSLQGGIAQNTARQKGRRDSFAWGAASEPGQAVSAPTAHNTHQATFATLGPRARSGCRLQLLNVLLGITESVGEVERPFADAECASHGLSRASEEHRGLSPSPSSLAPSRCGTPAPRSLRPRLGLKPSTSVSELKGP